MDSGARLAAKVENDAHSPFAMTAGDFAYVTASMAVGVSARGLFPFDLTGANAGKPSAGFSEWALTSTGSGQSAAAVAGVPSFGPNHEPYAFFLPSGRPQLGAVRIGTSMTPGAVVSEHVLSEALESSFPSALLADSTGLWIVDAVFGPGSSVRFYPYSGWDAGRSMLSEDHTRRFTVPDMTSPNRLVFANGGSVALVSYSYLAPAPMGAAGGVFAFDPATGTQLGKLVLSTSSTVSGASEFVGSVAASADRVIVVSAVKSAMFADLGGRIAIYKVKTWSPFAVEEPPTQLTSSLPNAVGVAVAGNLALVVDAPIGQDSAVDVVDLSMSPPAISTSLPIGKPYSMGFSIPGDPKISPDGTEAFIASEIGLLRLSLKAAPQ
jgi:hypothetical protein